MTGKTIADKNYEDYIVRMHEKGMSFKNIASELLEIPKSKRTAYVIEVVYRDEMKKRGRTDIDIEAQKIMSKRNKVK